MVEEIERLREQYQFFHWHLAFPQVFRLPAKGETPESEAAGWSGGFDVVLGNPPWEMPETDERVFFALCCPEIAVKSSARKRQRMIAELAEKDRALFQLWMEYLRQNDVRRMFFVNSGRYPYSGTGRLNYHRLFVEQNWNLVNRFGFVGMVVPSGIATNKYEELIWHHLLENKAIASLYDFENAGNLFPSVHRSMKFSLLTLTRTASEHIEVGCWLSQVSDLRNVERVAQITFKDLQVFDPGSLSLPQFRHTRDLDLLRAVYCRFKRFSGADGWKHTLRLMFSSSDRAYAPVPNASIPDWSLLANNRLESPDGKAFVPVYEGKMVGLFDHRKADIYINPHNPSRQAQQKDISSQQKSNPLRFARPQHWLEESLVREKRLSEGQGDWTLVFCDVTSATNERTCIPALIPLAGLTRSMPAIYLDSCSATDSARLSSILSSFALDFFARLKVSTNHLTQGIMESLPVPALSSCLTLEKELGGERWVIDRVLELAYTAWDLQPLAEDCGHDGPPFRWDEERRFLLRCELDAAYFHLYSIARDDVDYIMETFPIVKRKDEAAHGEYRTKRVILEIYDAMQRAIETGQPYQTLLEPPPADPQVAHPPREG